MFLLMSTFVQQCDKTVGIDKKPSQLILKVVQTVVFCS